MPRREYNHRRELFPRHPDTVAGNPSDATMAPTTASDSAPATTSASVVSKIPKSTPALATVMTLLGVALFAVFGTWLWKRRKARKAVDRKSPSKRSSFADEKHVDLENVSIYMEQPEKPKQALLIATANTRDTNVGWVPQGKIEPTRRPVTPPPASTTRSPVLSVRNASEPEAARKKTRSLHKPPSMKLGSLDSAESRVTSPPPAYGIPSHIILETEDSTPTSAAPMYLYPGSPGTCNRALSSGWYTSGPSTPLSNITVTTTTTMYTDGGLPPAPLPSPIRLESFNIPQILGTPPVSPSEVNNRAHNLPRLMSVVQSFEPTLNDELVIKVGDTVRMIEEYRDEWCLVQYVGLSDAPRGAVPRFCLEERKRIIPGPYI